MSSVEAVGIPFLRLSDPSFSIRSAEVRKARELSWYARTPYGIAVLRYEDVGQLLRDPRLRQGSYAWPAHNRVTGIFTDWWLRMVLNRANPTVMDRGDVEAALDRKIDFVLPLDPAVPQAVNQASPAVLADTDTQFSTAMLELARSIVGGDRWPVARQAPRAARILSFGRN